MEEGTFDEWAVKHLFVRKQLLTRAARPAMHCSKAQGGTNKEVKLGGVSELLVTYIHTLLARPQGASQIAFQSQIVDVLE